MIRFSTAATSRSNQLGAVAVASLALLIGLAGSPRLDPVPSPATAQCTNVAADPSPDHQLWHHPVDARIVDGFRPPTNPYGPGNRGLEYGTSAGDPVASVADGTVVFAGPVGRSRFVVVRHRSGIRSTYAYLAAIETSVGEVVARGRQIATAEPGFHLTARRGDTYLDPLLFMADGCFFVRLVAVPPAAALTPLDG